MKVLRYPVYAAGLALLRPAPLRPRPPQDPRGRRRGRLRRRLQHRHAVRHRVARHPRAGSPGPGVWDLKRAFADFWNLHRRQRLRPSERPLLLETASTWEPRIRLHRNVPRLWMFPIRGDVPRGDQPGQPQHLDDPRLLHPRPGLRRRAEGRGAARRRRTAAGAAEVQPHRRRLDLPRLLRPAARRRRADLPLPRRDGARQDLHHRRHLVDGRHRQHRPAQPAGQLRDQRRGHRRRRWPRRSRRSSRPTSPTASS